MLIAFQKKLHPIPDEETFENLFTEAAYYSAIPEDDGNFIDKVTGQSVSKDAYLGRDPDN